MRRMEWRLNIRREWGNTIVMIVQGGDLHLRSSPRRGSCILLGLIAKRPSPFDKRKARKQRSVGSPGAELNEGRVIPARPKRL